MVQSILNLTLVLIEVILRKISKERDSRQQQRTEVHVDTEVEMRNTLIMNQHPTFATFRLKLKTQQAAPTQLT